ncbi:hypothetical protein K438DRAFT_1985925 [Mycena galopus ATCC 62051]|nr:hypothetical protein K438DRAFT_1985925 [Mycena galopus ATCC 62051]
MADSPKEPSQPPCHDHEAAGGKMWAVYAAEAERYDKALIESWKSDMEGMLIFAGLFSAIVVAFLIESYKSLTPDPGDTTVLLLTQISNQLAAATNGSTWEIPPPFTFTASTSALVCNILWFISLGLSLACALAATLVEQWAREFMHRAEMRSAPIIRARVFAYLYYGLKRFKMHTVVEILPLLLHASLMFFFAGLVAFLIPVNLAVTLVTAILLSILAAVYILLTSLPLVYTDCPYRTPLSGTLWQVKQSIPRIKQCLFKSFYTEMLADGRTMVEVMFDNAQFPDDERLKRDKNALVWTMKSLADESELEPFVKAVPDVLWGPSAKRFIYEEPVEALINDEDPHVKLLDRIQALYKSCDTGLLTPDASYRRKIACYQAIWAIGSLTTPSRSFDPTLFHYIIANAPYQKSDWSSERNSDVVISSDESLLHYAVSAVAIGRWASFFQTMIQLNPITELPYRNSGIAFSGSNPNQFFYIIPTAWMNCQQVCNV